MKVSQFLGDLANNMRFSEKIVSLYILCSQFIKWSRNEESYFSIGSQVSFPELINEFLLFILIQLKGYWANLESFHISPV